MSDIILSKSKKPTRDKVGPYISRKVSIHQGNRIIISIMHLTTQHQSCGSKMGIEGRNSSAVTVMLQHPTFSHGHSIRENFSEKLENVSTVSRDLTDQEATQNHGSLCFATHSPQGPHLSAHMTTAHPVRNWCCFHCGDDGATKKDKRRGLELNVTASL